MPPPLILSGFPVLPNDGFSVTKWGFSLFRYTIYYVGLPQSHSQTTSITNKNGWIVKLEREKPDRMHLLNPLTAYQFKPLPEYFPKKFDFWNLQIRELGYEYTLKSLRFVPSAISVNDAGDLYMEKVALCFKDDGDFLLLTIHVSGRLVMYKSGDTKWSIINDLPSLYDDVIFYEGNFYATDNNGMIVIVNLNSGLIPTASLVALPVFGGDKKFLVESCGDLLLVDKYLSIGPDDDLGCNDDDLDFYEELDSFMSERTVKFKVFRLDRNAKIWTEVNTLGDRMLFLGDNSTFSASASDFNCGGKGNCITFTDQFSTNREEEGNCENRGINVFDLGTGSIWPINSYHGYAEMFWPPPRWLHPASTAEGNGTLDGLVQLNLRNFSR